MKISKSTKKIIEIGRDPSKLEVLTSDEAERLIDSYPECPCITGNPVSEKCGLSGKGVDSDDCREYIFCCPELITLEENPLGDMAKSYNRRYIPIAIQFYRALCLLDIKSKENESKS